MSQPIFLHNSEPKDRSLLIITGIVIALHCIFLVWGALTSTFVKPVKPPAPRRLVVQTVSLSPPASTQSVATREIVPTPPPVASTPIASPQIEEPIPEVKAAPKEIEAPKVSEKEKKSEPEPEKPAPKKEEKKTPPPKKVEPKKASPPPPKKPTKPVEAPSPKPVPTSKSTPAPKPPVKPVVKAAPPKPDKAATDKLAADKKEADKKAAEKAAEKVAAEKQAAEIKRKKEAEQLAAQVRQQELLSKAQERIAKIGQSKDKITSSNVADLPVTAVPSAITSLHIDALPGGGNALNEREISYRDELASRLKLLLKLPEYGAVKVKLTLDRSGKVVKVEVVSTESAANRKHIEKTLPNLTFPAFGSNFGDVQQNTFSVTLSNEL